MERMTEQDYIDIEYAMESVFDAAMEAAEGKVRGHILDSKTRDSLPDKAFGIVFKDAEGKTQRKYPLVVKSDPETTKELVVAAVTHFHFCKNEWRASLAKKILSVIKEEKISITINKKSQIFKYISEKDLPDTVKIVETVKR